MSEWNTKLLGEVAENTSRRFNFKGKDKVIFINTGDVLEGKFLHADYSEVAGLPGQAKKAIKKGDILYSEIRPGNKRYVYIDFDADDYVVSTKFMVIRPNTNEVSSKFLYMLLTSKACEEEFKIVADSRSGTFPQITFDSVAYYSIKYPESNDQERLVEISDSILNKIELNRQTNQTLELIAQALFKCWFVDFEPTRAKIIAKEKGANSAIQELAAQAIICGAMTLEQLEAITQNLETTLQQAINEKLNQANQTPINTEQLKTTAALFPNALVESELGEIPEGWEVVGFKHIVKKYIDNRGKTPPITDKGIPLLEVKHLPEGSIKPNLNTTKYVDDETFKSWFRAHLETDDIMISTVGTIGRICMVPEGEKIAIAQNLLGMRFKREKVSPFFMYYQMDGFRFRHDVDARLVITVQASIKRKDLETIDLLMPKIELQNQFEKFVKPFIAMQQSNQEIGLSEVRDILLPKLLSGELSVSSD